MGINSIQMIGKGMIGFMSGYKGKTVVLRIKPGAFHLVVFSH